MLTASATSLEDEAPALVRRAVAKRKTKARKRATKAETAKAEAAKAKPTHPADVPNRPGAFINLHIGGKRKVAPPPDDTDDEPTAAPPPRGPGGRFQRAASAAKDAAARVLSEFEAESFESVLHQVFVKGWEASDNFLTATAFDGEECFIWRSIDDDDTAFLVRRVLKLAKKNPVLAQQIRILVEHWDDYRVFAILGPRVMGTVGWYPAHGLDTRQWGGPAFPPTGPRQRPRTAPKPSGAGPTGPDFSANGHTAATEAFSYGN